MAQLNGETGIDQCSLDERRAVPDLWRVGLDVKVRAEMRLT